MTYQETIDYLYHKLPMFSRIGSSAFKKDLTNTLLICERLGNPQNNFRSVHIGGTNGKGSVSHMLAAVFQKAGYKTGLYTSPHLYDFRERIKIDGVMADEDFVIRFVEKVKPVIEEIEPSFFEITVAMAFSYFDEKGVDIAIIEVGLGGRLDSTNIIQPELSIITNIGYDHMNMLGNTLEAIAGEKAGIIKEKTPVVIGAKREQTKPVFESVAESKKATLYFAEDNFHVEQFNVEVDKLHVDVRYAASKQTETYVLELPGIYQVHNIKTVLQAVELLRNSGWKISDAQVKEGLSNAKKLTGLGGRWEVLSKKPAVVLEVAHNEDGITQMLEHLQRLSYKQLHIVFGMVKDKDIDKVLQLLPTSATYYFTAASLPRALPANELQELAAAYQLRGAVYRDVNTALLEAKNASTTEDIILVCGSIFLVAEVERSRFAST